MAGKALDVKFDVSEVERLVGRLGRLTGEEIGRASVSALNDAMDSVYTFARERMNAGINLDDPYLRRRMTVDRATMGKPVATLTASGAREDLTILARYDAEPRIVPAKTKRGAAAGPRRTMLPPGTKQSGVTVGVSKGNRDFIERGFMLPLKRGKEFGGNGLGVFARDRSGKLLHRYGPSVYQLFAYQLQTVSYEAEEELEDALVAGVSAAIEKAIES
jgi:hypothetical protein